MMAVTSAAGQLDYDLRKDLTGSSLADAYALLHLEPLVDPLQSMIEREFANSPLAANGATSRGAVSNGSPSLFSSSAAAGDVSDRLRSLVQRFTSDAESCGRLIETVVGSRGGAAGSAPSPASSSSSSGQLTMVTSSAAAKASSDTQLTPAASGLLTSLSRAAQGSLPQDQADALSAALSSSPTSLLELADVSLPPQPLLAQLLDVNPPVAFLVLERLLWLSSSSFASVAKGISPSDHHPILPPLDYLQVLLQVPACLQSLEVANRLILGETATCNSKDQLPISNARIP